MESGKFDVPYEIDDVEDLVNTNPPCVHLAWPSYNVQLHDS